MKDLWRPMIKEDYSAVGAPAVDANNFELKPTLITMVQQNKFTRHPSKDPNVGQYIQDEWSEIRCNQVVVIPIFSKRYINNLV